jgi:hypothetical protein
MQKNNPENNYCNKEFEYDFALKILKAKIYRIAHL